MHSRGYVLMIVLVLGVVMASLAGSLLYATTRDHTEARLQTSSVRAVYASEAAVAVGIERLRSELEDTVTPDLRRVETDTIAAATLALPGVTLPTLTVRYFDAATNATSQTPFGNASLSTITSGPNTGLRAQQTPIQVFAMGEVENAVASVADAIRIDLIPVFQFAMFFDGDFELLNPAPMTISGRVHTNGNFYVSGGFSNQHHIRGAVTIAGQLNGRSATQSGFQVQDFDILTANGAELDISNGFPFSGSTQATRIRAWGGTVSDSSTGAQPLTVPLRMTSAASCVRSGDCGAGRSCVRVRASDAAGVCTTDVVSRPDVCGNGATASFQQSLAVELIRRPRTDYSNTGALAPYLSVPREDGSGRHITSPYSVEFGPKPAFAATPADFNAYVNAGIDRSVPYVVSSAPDDDPGASVDRLYWKADIRIIDGIWYRKGRSDPIFDPERDGYLATLTPDPSDKRHQYARVLRYSWWWDSRESRVYCSSANPLHENCVQSGGRYQRGLQIRATDFDMAAFMALLQNPAAANELFPQGVPGDGVIVYVSETFDPSFEDASTQLPRAANVRNFLNFPVMHNHVSTPTDVTAALAISGRRDPARNTAVGGNPPTAYQLGWLPENIWGRRAPTNFESLTRPAIASNYSSHVDFGTGSPSGALKNSSTCALPQADFTSSAARRPSARPTNFTTPAISAPCIRGAVTPLGAENAVRFIRGHTVPAGGFTLVTDNRLYVQGDVNVRQNSAATSGTFRVFQDVPGSVAFIADSVTLMSARMTELQFQGPLDGFHRGPTQYTNARQWSADASPAAGFQPGVLPYGFTSTGGAAFANFCAMQNVRPFEMFLNASLLMGDVPACVDAGSAVGNNSGGVNNFPRFVEHWGFDSSNPVPVHINGSMVSLFRSEQGNSRFVNSGYAAFSSGRGSAYTANASCIYTPPDRRWVFDNTLLDGIDNLPPGTPRVVATDRLRWVRR